MQKKAVIFYLGLFFLFSATTVHAEWTGTIYINENGFSYSAGTYTVEYEPSPPSMEITYEFVYGKNTYSGVCWTLVQYHDLGWYYVGGDVVNEAFEPVGTISGRFSKLSPHTGSPSNGSWETQLGGSLVEGTFSGP